MKWLWEITKVEKKIRAKSELKNEVYLLNETASLRLAEVNAPFKAPKTTVKKMFEGKCSKQKNKIKPHKLTLMKQR